MNVMNDQTNHAWSKVGYKWDGSSTRCIFECSLCKTRVWSFSESSEPITTETEDLVLSCQEQQELNVIDDIINV